MKPYAYIFAVLIVFLSNYRVQAVDCNYTHIEKVDSCLVGMTLKGAVLKLQLNTAQYEVIEGLGGYLQGYHINLPGYVIDLYIQPVPTMFKSIIGTKELYIEDSEIISLQWRSKITGEQHTIYK